MPKRDNLLSEKVAEDLLERIISEELLPGSSLPPERELQERYQVSRTVVREAIKLLSARGLITASAGQTSTIGSDLTGPAADALLLAFRRAQVATEDVLSTRQLFEPQIVAVAAQNATNIQIRQLKNLCSTFTRISDDYTDQAGEEEKNRERWVRSDGQFHHMIAQATQNPALIILMEVIGIMWRQYINQGIYFSPEHRARGVKHHIIITEAIAARDPERARQAMIDHLSTTNNYLRDLGKLDNG
jgi:GntR family transcriptional regulator, transcriptional repressor for pyruvate dehydrogenase complex